MEQDQQGGVVAGYPIGDDVITGAVVKSARNGGKTTTTTRSGRNRLSKNKARNKGYSSQLTGAGDVYTSAQDKLKSVASPATKNDLINRIKQMPDEMLPQFIKPYADLMVNIFGIDTREKVANFLGQISAESLRGNAEYVYYSESGLKRVFSSRVKGQDAKDFSYKTPSPTRPYGFASGKAPWQIGGWPNAYYGSRNGSMNGNTFNKVSDAVNSRSDVSPNTPPSNLQINPYKYKGSPEGYAYRGHGVIQITGKVQYEQMNKFFGVNGTLEKNNVDFLKNPEIVSENKKYAFLSALMWWYNHQSVYINQVSLSATKTITTRVRGRSGGYQERHRNVERYFYYLLNGVKPAPNKVAGTYSINRQPTFTKVIKPSQLKFLSIIPSASPITYQSRFGVKTFSNLSYFEPDGTPTPPYKDKTTNILKRLPGQRYPVFGIDSNNVAKIYSSDDVFLVWDSLVYACAGFPRLIQNGKPVYSDFSGNYGFGRLTGRTAIGIKPSGELVIYVSKSKYLSDVINDLLSLGCTEGINFDGGGSSFVYDNNTPLITSSRNFPTIMTWV